MKNCIDPFKNLNIVSGNGGIRISPCCLSPTSPVSKIDFVYDAKLTQIRNSWQSGISPPECINCQTSEEQGLSSRRLGSNQWYNDHNLNNFDIELIRIDFWVGDLCNLKCAICGPENSSAWKQELGWPITNRRISINKSWKDLDLTTIRYVHFNGGEPLLSKEHINLLDAIPYKENVHIFYNTNATVKPSDKLLDLWSRFKLIQLDFSIDDIDDRFHYQRYPAVWENVVDNLTYFRNNCPVNCIFGVNTSLGILNYSNYENLKNWFLNNFSTNRVTDPVSLRTQPTLGILSLDNVSSRKQSIVRYLDKLDASRQLNWRSTFPELNHIL